MSAIGPHAYVYLSHPYLSSGETMLYHVIQHMCFTGALRLRYLTVPAHPRNPRPVDRLFLSRGPRPDALSSAEAWALDLVPEDRAISLGDLRRAIDRRLEDYETFKFAQMLPDLIASGMLSWRYWRTSEGRTSCRRTRDLLKTVEDDIGRSLDGGVERSMPHVQELGSCIVLLDEDTRDKLKEISERPSDLTAVFSILTYLESGGVFSDPSLIGGLSIGGSFGGGGGGGGGGFGGFGGGGFGGGGAGGSW